MSSAMAAVALRRERRKVNKPPRGHSSHYNSVLSLARSRSVTRGATAPKRPRSNSLSTLGSVAPGVVYKRTKYRRTLRVLMFGGTAFLIAGLVLIFIGVGSNQVRTRNMGLALIAFGTCLCLTKVFIQQKQQSDLLQRAAPATSQSGDSLGSVGEQLATKPAGSSIAATPDTDVSTPMLDEGHDIKFDSIQLDGIAGSTTDGRDDVPATNADDCGVEEDDAELHPQEPVDDDPTGSRKGDGSNDACEVVVIEKTGTY